MSEPYLILHKVRGEPAFDIAIQLKITEGDGAPEPWWIIPTSGHRAYPWWSISLSEISWGHDITELSYNDLSWKDIMSDAPLICPPDIPDHYSCNSTPKPKPQRQLPSSVSTLPTTDDFLI